MEARAFGRARRALVAAALALVAAAAVAPAAEAGTVGVTGTIRGAGSMLSTEGGPYNCTLTNGFNQNASSSCGRLAFEAAFEAWVWLRAVPSSTPAGNWSFAGWQNCDTTRVTANGTECAVHSGPFTLDERLPVAVFVDVATPTVSLTAIPGRVGTSTIPVSFSTPDPTASLRCRVDNAATFTPCSPGNYTFADGPHTFRVVAVDPSGRVSTEASTNFTTDTIAPTATLSGGPGEGTRVNSRTASFTLSANETATFKCSLDSVVLTPCGSPFNVSNLTDGVHVVRLQANDGLRDGPVVTRSWTVDTVPPETAIASGPQGGERLTARSAAFTFASPDGVAFECSLDGRPFAPCTSPDVVSDLALGQHSFSVRARDAAGNVDPTPAGRTWHVVPVDSDGDGHSPPADCDDASAAINPAATDVPDNGADEDCDGADAKTPPTVTPAITPTPPPVTPVIQKPINVTLAYFMSAGKKATTFSSLAVKGVPAGAKIAIRCKGKCPRKSQTLTSAKGGTVNLTAFRRRALQVGTTLTVTVSKPGMTTMVKILKVRAGKRPLVTTRTPV